MMALNHIGIFDARMALGPSQDPASVSEEQPMSPYATVRWTQSRRDAPTYVPLTSISHVAHIEVAQNILEEGVIRARPISDESKLRNHAFQVVWLSPKQWPDGFRYGNVRFTFKWETIIQGRQAYWVETIERYHPPADRILVTNNHYPDVVRPYDRGRQGSVWMQTGSRQGHVWNSARTFEVMLEQDLAIQDACAVDFVFHHQYQCSVNKDACPERGVGQEVAGARIVAFLASKPSPLPTGQALTVNQNGKVAPNDALLFSFQQLCRDLKGKYQGSGGPITVEHTSAIPLAQDIFAAYARSATSPELPCLMALYKDQTTLLESCRLAMIMAFHLTDRLALPV
jgi:hypothetical protein